jgi:reductive dehalogenase
MFSVYVLFAADVLLLICAALFTFDSIREKEHRAPKFGIAGIMFALLLGAMILWLPALRAPLIVGFVLCAIIGFIFLLPLKPDERVLQGARGSVVGQANRFDERDSVFARCRIMGGGEDVYRRYYDMHPEREKPDAKRREKGFLGIPGSIDRGYRPHIAMMEAAFDIPDFLGPHAVATPNSGSSQAELAPESATEIVKNFAMHIGADMVGICRVNPLWVYSHRGEIHYNNWEDWGQELQDIPPYAVVIATEMNWEHVSAAPHTPTVAESAHDYAKGAYLSSLLARWFVHMGYRGVAQHTRNYDTLLVPLAIDAGLGELGRKGYLLTPQYGPRVRLFAILTDMPLIPDQPVSIGVDKFCQRCKKCADSCPSHSIPRGDKIIQNGVEKWKLDEETCFDYWRKVGTDCAICMSVCPYGRPGTLLHNIVRWILARSVLAQIIFPSIDNLLYGQKWRPRKVSAWLDYPTSKEAQQESY